MKGLAVFSCLMMFASVGALSFTQEIDGHFPKNTVIYHATKMHASSENTIARTDMPTHIIRLDIDLRGRMTTCEQAINALSKILVHPLQSQRFIFSIIGLCGFNQRGDKFAGSFFVRAELDPVDEPAAAFLRNFVELRKQTDFFGKPFLIEEAEGLILSLAVEIGIRDVDFGSAFQRLKRYASMHYFKSYFDVVMNFYVDTEQHFSSQDPMVLLPYYNRWFDVSPTEELNRLLREANYVELPVKLAYLMKSGERVYFPPWSTTFINKCYFSESKHCL